jgi:multimeric flavodoxin WrbA
MTEEQSIKHITAFVGSARRKHTYHAVRQFLDHLQAQGDVEAEIVFLCDYPLEPCRGCKLCFEKGEAACPLDDDRDVLIEKMMASDGVVLASPNYAFQVAATVKILLERLGYVLHRPCFFGKTFTSIVTQGIYGGGKIVRYLDFVGNGLGFNTVKGQCFTALEPMTEKEAQKQDKALAKQSRRFHKRLHQPAYPPPTWFDLMAFRMGRTSMRLELDERSRDYTYYRDQGWFRSDYYYPTRLGPLKKAGGALFDWLATRMTRRR